jgi:hypothetical protein
VLLVVEIIGLLPRGVVVLIASAGGFRRCLTAPMGLRGRSIGVHWTPIPRHQGSLVHAGSHRVFLNQIFSPLIARVRQDSGREFEATGWGRVDRTILKAARHVVGDASAGAEGKPSQRRRKTRNEKANEKAAAETGHRDLSRI